MNGWDGDTTSMIKVIDLDPYIFYSILDSIHVKCISIFNEMLLTLDRIAPSRQTLWSFVDLEYYIHLTVILSAFAPVLYLGTLVDR